MFDRGTPEYWNARKDAFRIVQALELSYRNRMRVHDAAIANPLVREILHAQDRYALLLHPEIVLHRIIEDFAADATDQCDCDGTCDGPSYEAYVRIFSERIDRWFLDLSPSLRNRALTLARECGYVYADRRPTDNGLQPRA
ncbi:MAG: hypothetical protein HQL38_07915 [Alphaproteobacteria bacterium]|nr:hypothetical protein [Alphaproteobacteria bacterium]